MNALSEEAILRADIRELGLRLLSRLPESSSVDVVNFLSELIRELPPRTGAIQPVHGRSFMSEPALVAALTEAWDWLFIKGLTSTDYEQSSMRWRTLTRLGRNVRANPALLPD